MNSDPLNYIFGILRYISNNISISNRNNINNNNNIVEIFITSGQAYSCS